MTQASYTPGETVQIAGHYRTLVAGLRELHDGLAAELQRAHGLVAAEVRDESFARVLVAAELMRGINKDERQPISSSAFLLSQQLRDSLRIAHDVGLAVAPFTLSSKQGLLSRYFGKRPPRLNQPAKEAILRIAAAHASSRNRSRTLSLAPPTASLPSAGSTPLLSRR